MDTTSGARNRHGFLHSALPVLSGLAASLALLGIYLTIVGLVQGWSSAVSLLRQDAYLVLPVTAAFGIQFGLFTYLRTLVRSRSRGTGALTGASGGTSAAAMVACCAHRVADLLPLLGLSAAAGFLAAWKVPFLLMGLALSTFGIGLILRRIILYKRRHMAVEAS